MSVEAAAVVSCSARLRVAVKLPLWVGSGGTGGAARRGFSAGGVAASLMLRWDTHTLLTLSTHFNPLISGVH